MNLLSLPAGASVALANIMILVALFNLIARAIPDAWMQYAERNLPRLAGVLRFLRAFGVDALKSGKALALGVVLGKPWQDALLIAQRALAPGEMLQAADLPPGSRASVAPPLPVDSKGGAK